MGWRAGEAAFCLPADEGKEDGDAITTEGEGGRGFGRLEEPV